MELIQLLTESLGVQESQAEGGAGLLFQLAKDKLGNDDFAKVKFLRSALSCHFKVLLPFAFSLLELLGVARGVRAGTSGRSYSASTLG